jgi:hypothetical protein
MEQLCVFGSRTALSHMNLTYLNLSHHLSCLQHNRCAISTSCTNITQSFCTKVIGELFQQSRFNGWPVRLSSLVDVGNKFYQEILYTSAWRRIFEVCTLQNSIQQKRAQQRNKRPHQSKDSLLIEQNSTNHS